MGDKMNRFENMSVEEIFNEMVAFQADLEAMFGPIPVEIDFFDVPTATVEVSEADIIAARETEALMQRIMRK